jgi:hypothetical protein
MSLNGWGSSDPDQNVAGSSISESVDSAGNITTDFGPAGGGSTAVASQAMSPAELSLLAGKKGSTTVMPSYGYQPPLTLGQKISQGIGNFASGVGNYLTSGGIWGTVAQGLDKFRDWNNAMQRNRFQKQYERKNPHPMGFVWDDWTEKDWAEKSIDEIPGYREYLTGLTPQQTGEGGGMPLWQQLGYPSYEAWAAQNQGIAGTELDDDVITSDDIALRFLGADRTLNPQAVGLENTDQLREMIQERVKNLYT